MRRSKQNDGRLSNLLGSRFLTVYIVTVMGKTGTEMHFNNTKLKLKCI